MKSRVWNKFRWVPVMLKTQVSKNRSLAYPYFWSSQRVLKYSTIDRFYIFSNPLLVKKLKKKNVKFLICYSLVGINRDKKNKKEKYFYYLYTVVWKMPLQHWCFLKDSVYVRTQLVLKWWHFEYKYWKFDEEKTPCYDLWQ